MSKISINEFNTLLQGLSKEEKKFLLFRYFLEYPEEYYKFKGNLIIEKDLKKINVIARKIGNTKIVEKSIKEDIDHYYFRDVSYKNILLQTKKLINELNLNNSLEIANLFSYLLWNGYFSLNESLVYQKKDRYQIPREYSHDIMSGRGVCLNFSYMLADLINEFDYSSAIIINYIDSKATKKNYKPPIKRNFSKKDSAFLFDFLLPIKKQFGNHAFNLIKEQNEMYIYDCTNFNISKLNNKYSARMLNGRGNIELKPFISYLYNDSLKSLELLDHLHTSESFKSSYNILSFIGSFECCIDKLKENKELLNDFYSEIIEDIKYIDKTNKDIKKYIKY